MYLQVQYQQIADASNPDQASTNPIPASCRCFRPRPGICSSNTSKLQILPHPESTPICIYKSNISKLWMLPNPTRHLQLQYQQIADASNPDQTSANSNPASCRYFRPRPGICSSNTSKLQMLPTPGQASATPIPTSCRCFQPQDRHLQLPKTTNQRYPPVNFLLKFAGGHLYFISISSLFHLYCISISSNSYICLFLIRPCLLLPVSSHLFWTFPVFHRFPYALLWKSLPTRPLLLLSVPDGFCPR